MLYWFINEEGRGFIVVGKVFFIGLHVHIYNLKDTFFCKPGSKYVNFLDTICSDIVPVRTIKINICGFAS
jgi:hypothetical protein